MSQEPPVIDVEAEAVPIPEIGGLIGQCGTCKFARRADPTNFASPNMICCRFPPTVIPLFQNGKLAGSTGMFPAVLRTTPACGEYEPRIKQ